ncbi:hypothetical protein [Deinococcus soli (ex Cha et al. 2016)]|uniref:Uncharacterized protein n=2 Tax=Deinococcus soli (ex Cha et al. 2016) TaxID=1309411 RepID=A0ACC6KKR6_9DEIO|nr:hypothetical protein [Deinococcus soli (ex Cha et al. 2016)]MDR6218631.1 hypothetical protein [Deinococcus soli (ex Cha et al. 2016)]MDR6328428.1 hypothetical protein [Deinococcus soli (ex Cha et al. 2016)]MDR6753039.1 hypothetical protein [Deinococcus soli (ex Cha et al. 2016)]
MTLKSLAAAGLLLAAGQTAQASPLAALRLPTHFQPVSADTHPTLERAARARLRSPAARTAYYHSPAPLDDTLADLLLNLGPQGYHLAGGQPLDKLGIQVQTLLWVAGDTALATNLAHIDATGETIVQFVEVPRDS